MKRKISKTWIKCSDQLPELFEEVLVCYKGVLRDVAFMCKGKDRKVVWVSAAGDGCTKFAASTVTHWARLPELPRD
jgi:hypothetical protein